MSTSAGVKTGYHTLDGHISQIPGLSPSIRTLPEERARGRRTVVLESDSAYVKLAKQGGHKGTIMFLFQSLLWFVLFLLLHFLSPFFVIKTGLLSQEEAVTSTPNSYKPPDWFCSESGDISQQRCLKNLIKCYDEVPVCSYISGLFFLFNLFIFQKCILIYFFPLNI